MRGRFHGDESNHEFTVAPPLGETRYRDLTGWDPCEDSFVPAAAFCTNCTKRFEAPDGSGAVVYKCNGHEVGQAPAPLPAPTQPASASASAVGGLPVGAIADPSAISARPAEEEHPVLEGGGGAFGPAPAAVGISREGFEGHLWQRSVRTESQKKPNWLLQYGLVLDASDRPVIANLTSPVYLEGALAVSREYLEEPEFNGLILFRNKSEIPLPSVAYAGHLILLARPNSKLNKFSVKHSGFNCEINPNESVEIDPSAPVTIYESDEEYLGIVWYSVRSETSAPRLRELGFRPRADSFQTDNLSAPLKDSMTAAAFTSFGIERQVVERLTKECPDYGTLWHYKYLEHWGLSKPVIKSRLTSHGHSPGRINEAVNMSSNYDFQEGILYEIKLLPREHAVTLRVCVPRGAAKSVQVLKDLEGIDLRRELILWHHNSIPFGMHSSLDSTVDKLSVKFTWPSMVADVEKVILNCPECKKLRGRPFISAALRADTFEGPFHCLFFDHVGELRPTTVEKNRYLLTCVCAFSGWGWAIPVPDTTAKTTAEALMTRVFCDLSGFPMILRHDRSKSFLGEVIKEVNSTFGMTSVVGSSWRPQSQGKIETQHRKLSQMLKQLCESSPENWDQKVAYAVWAWRTTPQPSLGGLSPYRIITGMQPRTPFGSATAPLGRTRVTTNEWVKQVLEVFEQTTRYVRQFQDEQAAKRKSTQAKHSGTGTFEVGDFVLVLRPEALPHVRGRTTQESYVSPKLTYRTYPDIYIVSHKLSNHTFAVKHSSTGEPPKLFENPVHLQRLIPVSVWNTKNPDVNSLDLKIELKRGTTVRKGSVIAHGYLGHCRVHWDDGEAPEFSWIDLTKEEYSWIS